MHITNDIESSKELIRRVFDKSVLLEVDMKYDPIIQRLPHQLAKLLLHQPCLLLVVRSGLGLQPLVVGLIGGQGAALADNLLVQGVLV